jgi:AraC-like DNA-binding protein
MLSPQIAWFQPHPQLMPYVECYWMMALPQGVHMPPQRMPADARIELLFNFGDPSVRAAADGSDLCKVTAHSYILGARGQGYSFEHLGEPRYAAVRFKPGGLSAFTRIPLADMSELHVGLEDLWGRGEAHELEVRLEAAQTHQLQAHLLESALLAHLQPPEHLARLLYAVGQVERADDALTLRGLADEINMSDKHFERLFARYVGFRPSLFARVTRFQQVMYRAMAQPDTNLGHLAQNAGYYDQAHFNKDFKRFSGSAPSEFLAEQHEFIRASTPSHLLVQRL